MSEYNNLNSLTPDINMNINSLTEIKHIIKDFFSKIKNFILNLTINKDINNDKLNEDIISFNISLIEIGNSLMKLGFTNEKRALAHIKNRSTYILKRPELFDKYSYFITELLDLLVDLMSHLGDKNYNNYLTDFNKNLEKYKEFFRENIHSYTAEDEKNALMFARAIWEPV